METNKILLGGLAGGVAFFLLGWVIYGILLMDYTMASYKYLSSDWFLLAESKIFTSLLRNVRIY